MRIGIRFRIRNSVLPQANRDSCRVRLVAAAFIVPAVTRVDGGSASFLYNPMRFRLLYLILSLLSLSHWTTAVEGQQYISMIATSTLCPSPRSLHHDASSGIVVAACFDGGIIQITGTSITTIANSNQCPSPTSVYRDTSTGIVYAACNDDGVISIRGGTVTTIATST